MAHFAVNHRTLIFSTYMKISEFHISFLIFIMNPALREIVFFLMTWLIYFKKKNVLILKENPVVVILQLKYVEVTSSTLLGQTTFRRLC